MPSRRLANSNPTRFRAISAAKELKDAVPAPLIIPFTPGTITRLDTFYPLYKSKIEAGETALQAQLAISEQIKQARLLAEYHISDFYDALQRAIRRQVINASVRTFYGLDGSDATLPAVKTEADISFWGGKAATGEAARIAAGGAPITYPSITEVNTAVNAFKNLNQQQANAKIAFDTAQEAIANDNPEADKLILKMWNEIEATFDEGNKPSMRRKAREWGVVYIPSPGEAPSPDEFSIMGKITEQGTGTELNEVEILVTETATTVLSDAHGDYFIGILPPGSYTLQITKALHEVETLPVTVTAGTITTLNVALNPVIILNGTVSGVVNLTGMPAMGVTVSVEGFPLLTTTTNASGQYTLVNIPIGMQTIRAQGGSVPGFQTQNINVVAGPPITVNFNF